jgi:hypothetical protein
MWRFNLLCTSRDFGYALGIGSEGSGFSHPVRRSVPLYLLVAVPQEVQDAIQAALYPRTSFWRQRSSVPN